MTSKIDTLLEKWYNLKQEISKQQKLEEQIRDKIKTAMITKKMKEMITQKYKVSVSHLTRETLSKKDCPKDVWEKFYKTSKFDVVKLTKIHVEEDHNNDEEIDI